ncbi:L,D-transpeptidase/peptidoglycan binding protein [Microbacterium sp. HD4P20]|uniref:L,D-transpeptidase family protein n=1 Tax=Microbacterium sp. HD4P20 TaxID=2864874 RepID=UPI001C63E58A|nr:L,D-transpeptidase family protein [Microbacterium sp. HD4P20]MCP2635081.1 L,D-transpeptidase/peptidoglycan binding protein [Microbacterium sp. HD4P20]
MTDLATKPNADEASNGDAAAAIDAQATAELGTTEDSPAGGGPDAPAYVWAPPEPQPKKHRTAMWIGIGVAAAAAAAAIATSLILIAPGTTVAGVPVGGLTPGAAADAIEQGLAETAIVLGGDGGGAEVTGSDLGASVDARGIADAAFAEHPMWNPTTWFSAPIEAEITLDPEAATASLRAAAPDLYTDPVDATLAFDPASATYVVTPAVLGTGIDVAAVQQALQNAFDAGGMSVEFDVVPADIEAAIPTPAAEATAAQLNGMLDTVGFYVGEERTVPVDRAVAASWLTVTPAPAEGAFEISADAAAIQPVVDGLAEAVNRAPENALVITNSAGRVLRTEAAGQSGRELGDTQNVANDFATQLSSGDAAFDLPVNEVPVTTVSLARRIEVDLGDQRAYLFENENLVGSYVISSGLSDTPTPTGNFTVNGYSRQQSMGCFEGAPYCVRDVPWVTWFAPDIGFHGANSLRSSLGFPQSHGCVNMWDGQAKFIYDWSAMGTEVWVHH